MEAMWITIFILIQLGSWISSDQGVIEEKPVKQQSGSWKWDGWTAHQSATNPAGDQGWWKREPPGTPPRYITCSTGVLLTRQPNNWLRSGQISVSNINRVDLTLRYSINQCSGSYCTEVIDLYANQSDTYLPSDKYPNPVDDIEAYQKFGSLTGTSGVTTTKTVSLSVNGTYLLLAFHDQGGCKVVYSVKVTYYFCPGETLSKSLVSVQRTVAPASDLVPVDVTGRCLNNTVALPGTGSLTVQCLSDGKWNESGLDGRCFCREGMENTGGKCEYCPKGKYNMQRGANCSLCPGNSESANDRRSCSCEEAFYRAPGESATVKCTAVPSAPRHLIVQFVNQTAVILQWSPPNSTGGRSDVYYDVECRTPLEGDAKDYVKECQDDVIYTPNKRRLNMRNVKITNLVSFVNYTFIIYAKNGVSAVASCEDTKFTSLRVRTNATVPDRLTIEVVKLSETSVRVSWTLDQKNGIMKAYRVLYAPEEEGQKNEKVISTMETSVFITGLTPGEKYRFRVTAENHVGLSSSVVATVTLDSGGVDETVYIAVIIVVVTLLLIVLVALIVSLCRRRSQNGRYHERNNLPEPRDQTERGRDNTIALVERPTPPGVQNDALYTNVEEVDSFELRRDKIEFQKLLGSGSFGEVFKAVIRNRIVAVKSLKENALPKDKQDLQKELNVMKQLQPHPHLVQLIGYCSYNGPLLIVLEYLPYGDLLGYLRKSRGHKDNYNSGEKAPKSKLTASDLLSFAWMIADGMSYLALMKVVHRDLAARNVLVGENKVCKISDFGLARGVDSDIYVRRSKTRLPVKWMPPESLFHGLSSTMSDVWSYGILLWEVFTIGDSPYPGIKANQVASLLRSGYRMTRPLHISEELFAIMSKCWSQKPEDRPTFKWIRTAIKRLQKDKKICVNLDLFKDGDYVNFDMFNSE